MLVSWNVFYALVLMQFMYLKETLYNDLVAYTIWSNC